MSKIIDDIHLFILDRIKHFFEHYKDLEKGKWVKFIGWENVKKAREEIIKSVQAYPTHK
jgi:inorganic pyrophosphatase